MPIILVIVFAIVAIQIVALFLLLPAIRRQRARELAAVNDELAKLSASGETLVAGPQLMHVREGHVTSRRTVYLTDKRLVILGGKAREDIDRKTITAARTDKWFKTNRSGGHTYVILTTADGEFALHLRDANLHAWSSALGAKAA